MELRRKTEVILRDKALVALQRDRAAQHAADLEAQLRAASAPTIIPEPVKPRLAACVGSTLVQTQGTLPVLIVALQPTTYLHLAVSRLS